MNCATLSPRCARNLLEVSVQYLNEGNGRAMRITTVKFCRKCGAAIPPDSPQQSCGACLLETALGEGELERELDVDSAPSPTLMDFGDYELLEQIGCGGQGVVFRARQKSLNRTVALKMIRLGQWASRTHLKRFRREAEAAARLDHPGIVPIYEVGERDGSCYFSMKFVEGGQLDAVVSQKPMSIRQAVELISKIARTVHYAHEHGILHRDIKPGNVLLDTKREPHLTDFGLARLVETDSTVTRTMEVMGTPSYMAPEQAVGNSSAVSSLTDVYGIGAVLYQLLTGQPPFAGGTTYETIKALVDSEPRPPRLLNRKIDNDLSTICLKCLEKDPKRRYASALAMAEDLERWLKHEPVAARRTGLLTRGAKWIRRNPTTASLAAALIVLVAVLGWNARERFQAPITSGIAVLPFGNLSEQKEDGAFVDGLQDDILTKLAQIAGLKVISRTSVMEYRGRRNVRAIGNLLRVSHVLEGSARRNGSRIHVNAQLIDTRTDTHIWAEQFDRDINDLFAVQSEIAQTVADQLHAKMSAAEKLAVQRKPTTDLVAFDLYSRANAILYGRKNDVRDFPKAVDLLNQAVARDPSFLEAYCQLAFAHDRIYWDEVDHTPARLTLAQTAIQEAFRVRPGSGEAHLAQAQHLYHGYKDYDGALAELEVARQTLPNRARLFQLMGFIQGRQGRWEDSMRNLERAAELDPRDVDTLMVLGWNKQRSGHTAEAKSWIKRAVAVADPDDASMQLALPDWETDVTANPEPLHQAIASLLARNPAAKKSIATYLANCAFFERDTAAVRGALDALDNNEGISFLGQAGAGCSRAFTEGVLARMEKDEQKAQWAFAAARSEQEKVVEAHPDRAAAWCMLGIIDAGLGRKEEALRESRRAVELLPIERDAIVGPRLVEGLAISAAWTGEKDLACEQLAIVTHPPCFVSYASLKLLPIWDPLRGDPCFEKIVDSLAPKKN